MCRWIYLRHQFIVICCISIHVWLLSTHLHRFIFVRVLLSVFVRLSTFGSRTFSLFARTVLLVHRWRSAVLLARWSAIEIIFWRISVDLPWSPSVQCFDLLCLNKMWIFLTLKAVDFFPLLNAAITHHIVVQMYLEALLQNCVTNFFDGTKCTQDYIVGIPLCKTKYNDFWVRSNDLTFWMFGKAIKIITETNIVLLNLPLSFGIQGISIIYLLLKSKFVYKFFDFYTLLRFYLKHSNFLKIPFNG